ncbi:MAG TPA: hypothetical protein VEZ71_06895 [Archangium sp.]|nr:hypothetical protein [Archangium sp.]
MLKAELHNKLPDETRVSFERMEDLLTSNLLGSLTYLPAELVLLPWLRQARPFPPEEGGKLVLDGVRSTQVLFWPRAGHRQADALVLLQRHDGPPEPILIECKYEMGMSNAAAHGGPDGSSTGNQLTDYWRSLDKGAVTPTRHEALDIPGSSFRGTCIIYITAHGTMPGEALQRSWDLLSQEEKARARFFWLSWRDLHAVLNRARGECKDDSRQNLLADLIALLQRKSLIRFRGFEILTPAVPLRTTSPHWRVRWQLHPPAFLASNKSFEQRQQAPLQRTERWTRLLLG